MEQVVGRANALPAAARLSSALFLSGSLKREWR
jgi:hypothetical protein